VVSFLDVLGIRHTVEVQAETLFEAAALAISAFREHECEPGDISQLEVEVRKSVTHTVTPRKVREWIDGGSRSPREAVMKDRLRSILS
jgi:hypothetical protein